MHVQLYNMATLSSSFNHLLISHVHLFLILQSDTGATEGQIQVESVPQHPVEGAVSGGKSGVSLEAAFRQLTHSLRELLDQLQDMLI